MTLTAELCHFFSRLLHGELNQDRPEDIAMALDDLAFRAWCEVRELSPNSLLLEGEIVDNSSSVPPS
jgi:hypothetical protein